MTKTTMIASLALAVLASVSANVAAVELKNASYFCTVEFAAGLKFNESLKKWESTTFRPDHKFVLKLRFVSEGEKVMTSVNAAVAYFNVTITESGAGYSSNCLFEDRDPLVPVDWFDLLSCGLHAGDEYKFSLVTNRFLNFYKWGYVRDHDLNTPSVSGGTCTKID